MISWFAKNDVAANLLMVALILGGILAFKFGARIETFPATDPNTVSVSVALRGATPEDMEQGVAQRIEESIADLEGVEKITSSSSEGRTSVTIEVDESYDPRDLLADIKSRVDSINTFPVEAEKPVVSLAQREFSVINVIINGEADEDEVRRYAESVKENILRLPNITRADLSFAPNFEIGIEISQDRLRQFGLTLNDVAKAINSSSQDISAGNLRSSGGDVLLRSKGQAYYQHDFENIVLKTNKDGTFLTLGDLANVKDGFEEDNVVADFDGNNAIMIRVYRVGDQSAIDVANEVKDYVNQAQASLPAGMRLFYWDDDSESLKDRLSTLIWNMISGGILVFLLLALFLRPAVAAWVFVGIPISFVASFMVLVSLGVSVNLISLYGFILVLGLVVDDAIVTGESIYAHQRTAVTGLEAAIQGAQRVAIPVTFGVLTTICAFLPMVFLEGRMATLMVAIPAVAIPVLIFSLIESKFVLPAHLKHLKPKKENDITGFSRWQNRFANRFESAVVKYYRPMLNRVLDYRYSVFLTFVGMLVLMLVLVTKGWIQYTTFPRIPADTIRTSLQMPVGTPFNVTDKHVQRIAGEIEALRTKYTNDEGESGIAHVMAITGGRGGNINEGTIYVDTNPDVLDQFGVSASSLTREWRQRVGNVSGAESLTFRAEAFRFGDPINIQLAGNSFKELEMVADKVKEHLATYPTVFDIADSMSSGKEEIQVDLTEQGYLLGLRRSEVLSTISAAFRGVQAQRIQRGRDDIRVIVRLPLRERSNLNTLNELLISTPEGTQVPLGQVARFKTIKGPSQITRIDRLRVLSVTADYSKANTNSILLNDSIEKYMGELLAAYPGITYSLEGEAKESRKTAASMEVGVVAMLFAIYCLLALPLKSYTQPLIVMSVIPFSLIGMILGHLIMAENMTFQSYLGVMALIGIVINDSLVLVDFVNQERKPQHQGLREAVLNAGVARFRAIMLTSLTTFIGIFPMMIATTKQAMFLVPMAISLGFGVLFATFITLTLVPVVLMISNDIKRFFRRGNQEESLAINLPN